MQLTQPSNPRPALALAALLAFAATGLASSPAYAGPWVKKPGESYAKVSGSYFTSGEVYDVRGDLVDPEFDYSHLSVHSYAEIGLFPRIAMSIGVPFLNSTNTVNERTHYSRAGFGDLDLGLSGQIYRGRCSVAGEVGARIPLYDTVIPSDAELSTGAAATAGPERYFPALGDGSYDFTPGVSLGCSLHPFPAWITASGGVSMRTRGFGEGAFASLDGGAYVWPGRLALTARVATIRRFSAVNERPTKEYTNLGGGALFNIWGGWGLEAGAQYTLEGAFAARGASYTVGFSYSGEVFDNPW